jgi:hypothetical protein
VNWSIRDNINLQESGILFAMNNTATNRKTFLENFYLKSKRSVEKAAQEGPAAWVIPSDDPRPVECAELVNLLELQGVEVNRISQEMEVAVKQGKEEKKTKIPAASYVVRMDQPYSRMADMLLDTQYYNVSDPRPYDDTGWTLGALRNVKTIRITDPSILKASMTLLNGPVKPEGKVVATSTAAYIIDHNTDNTLATFRFRLRDVKMSAAEEAFKAAGKDFHAGAFVIPVEGNASSRIQQAAIDLGLKAYGVDAVPKVAMHSLAAPRIALVHSWLNTQNEGWYRIAFDNLKIPYEYISDQKLRQIPDLRASYDVVILGPTPGNAQRVVNGMPMRGDPIPWKASELTPNLGASPDTTGDMRGGMGMEGLLKIAKFVDDGGLFVTVAGNDSIPIDYGLIDGVSISTTRELQARGSVLKAVVSDKKSPITYGYGDSLAVYFSQAPVLQVSTTGGFGGFGGFGGDAQAGRPTGRGSATDPDIPQARPFVAPPEKPQLKPGEEAPLDEDVREFLRPFLPGPEARPRVVLRFSDEKELLVSGMLAGGRELANRPAVVDVPRGKGHVLLFANNPIWRNETQGSYFLLFNALLNYDHLGAGATPAKPATPPTLE